MESLIQEFIDYLGHEKGLATNTLESYGRDLRQYHGFLAEDTSQTLETASQATRNWFLPVFGEVTAF